MWRKSILFSSMILILILAISSFVIGCGDDDETVADPTETATPKDTATPAQMYKIGITKIVTHPALDANEQGFIDKLAELGFVEGENVQYSKESAEGDIPTANTIAQMFVDERVDLIHSIATPTSQAAVGATEETGIPVVFGSVTDPVDAGLIASWESPGANVTGISDWLEISSQIEMILSIMPEIGTIGTVYNPGEANAVVQVEALKEAAPGLGIGEVIDAAATSSAEVMTAAQSLVGRVDAIWVGTDNTVVSAFEALVTVCDENDIPLFAADNDSVKRGAIAALGMDYYQVGMACGEMAARILNGESASDIPAQKIDLADLEVYVNPSAAESMGITIPEDVLSSADEIVTAETEE